MKTESQITASWQLTTLLQHAMLEHETKTRLYSRNIPGMEHPDWALLRVQCSDIFISTNGWRATDTEGTVPGGARIGRLLLSITPIIGEKVKLESENYHKVVYFYIWFACPLPIWLSFTCIPIYPKCEFKRNFMYMYMILTIFCSKWCSIFLKLCFKTALLFM